MAALITAIQSWVTAVVAMVSDWLALVTATGNEILLLTCVAIPLVGVGISALSRMMRARV